MSDWAAEVVVDEEWACRLLSEQFEEVDLGSIRLLGEGWDNTVWLVDGRWVFRFPRREIAVPAVARQLAVLPRLAPLLPHPIPTPRFAGRPALGYPWPFYGAPFLPGREAPDVDLGEADRVRLGSALGAFLRALHAVDAGTLGPDDLLPVDPMRRADMTVRLPRAAERLEELERLGLWPAPSAVQTILGEALDLPAPNEAAVAHGDLHVRHVLVGERAVLAGVIDWDDVCRADPSVDLELFWSLLPQQGRAAFLDAYGAIPDERLLRARVLAIFLCATLATYAHHERRRNRERAALAGLRRACTD